MCRNKYCVLIVAYPTKSQAIYLDSGRHHKKKDYEPIKRVLNEALTNHAFHGGPMIKQYARNGKLIFVQKPDFKSGTQPKNSKLDAYYVLMLFGSFNGICNN